MTTPYDGKVFLWHWKGSSLAETSVEEVVRSLKQWASHVRGVFVKTTDGTDWMGKYDAPTELAINNTASIARWVQVLEAGGLEFHAWCVPNGLQIEAEADLIIESCKVRGVKSLILDIEPYAGFWQGGRAAIQPFMMRLRRGLGGSFHIGMSVDPRPHHYASIYPNEWRPYINSIHPQTYWTLFERPLREVLDEAYQVWGGYGLPIYPVLQGNAPPAEIAQARDYATMRHRANALSWWRLGVIGPAEFVEINRPITPVEPPPDNPPLGGDYGVEVVVNPQDPRFVIGTHTGEPVIKVLSSFRNAWGWATWYKPTAKEKSVVWARWDPQLSESGWYEVAVFIPARHANTANARYKLHGAIGEPAELLLPLNQSQFYNLWVPLGIFKFDANDPRAGVVFLNDLTGETDKAIAFDAIRYRQIIGRVPNSRFLADGYDAPVGTSTERNGSQIWTGYWYDATGFGKIYYPNTPSQAYHTGADLNMDIPYFDADAHSPVYASASGVVTFAGRLPAWGNVIVIRHDPLITTGMIMFSRSAHVNNIRVKVGDRVQRGQQIANVGNADGLFPYHLHFDLSPTNKLEAEPWDWPKMDYSRLMRDYVDPKNFIMSNRPIS